MLEATKCLQPCVGGSIVLSSFSRGAFPLDRCQVVSVAGLRKHTLRKEVGGFFFYVCLFRRFCQSTFQPRKKSPVCILLFLPWSLPVSF